MKKRLLAFACAAAIALTALSGCGKKDAQAQPVPVVQATQVSANNLADSHEMTGIVDSYVDGKLTLEIPDQNKAYLFNLAGAELRATNGINNGDTVTVFYVAPTQEGGDARVLLVVDTTQKASHNLGTMHGTIVDATMHNIILRAANGTQYSFDKTGAEVYAVNGLVIGNIVDISYTVKDGVNVAVSITDNAANTKEYSPLPDGITLVVGTETLMAANNINVYAGAGTQYSRIGGITAGNKVYITGTCTNGWARINYGGKEGYVPEEHLVPVPEPAKPTPPAAPPVPTQPSVNTTPAAQPAPPATSNLDHPIGQGVTMDPPPAAPVPVPHNDNNIGQGVTVNTPPAVVPEQTPPPPAQSTAPPVQEAPPAETGIGQGATPAPPAETGIGQGATPAPPAETGIGQGATPAPPAETGIGQGATPAPPAETGIGGGATIGGGIGIGGGVTLNTAPQFLDMTGIVVDATADSLVMTGDDGNTYTFNLVGATTQCTNGMQPGNPVTVHYSGTINGTDTTGVSVMMVTVTASNSPIAGMVSMA